MRFVSVRELRIRPGAVWKRLRADHDLVLTSRGRPMALLTDIDEDSLEHKLDALRRERAHTAIEHIRRVASEKGLDRITLEEINEEIAACRASRRGAGPRR